jgi:cytochrome c oxidase assembly factor CtaG
MEAKKTLLQKLAPFLYGIVIIILGLVIVSWFVEYPKWLDNLLTKTLLVALGLIFLYQAWRIRKRDSSFALIYFVVGICLIILTIFKLTFLKIIAVAGLVLYILSRFLLKKEKKES